MLQEALNSRCHAHLHVRGQTALTPWGVAPLLRCAFRQEAGRTDQQVEDTVLIQEATFELAAAYQPACSGRDCDSLGLAIKIDFKNFISVSRAIYNAGIEDIRRTG